MLIEIILLIAEGLMICWFIAFEINFFYLVYKICEFCSNNLN
jgi:hypothetical protein